MFGAFAVTFLMACSSGPPIRRAPLLTTGGASAGASVSAGSGAGGAALAADGGIQDEEASPCDHLATCCTAFDPMDPVVDLCEQMVSLGDPGQCDDWAGTLRCPD